MAKPLLGGRPDNLQCEKLEDHPVHVWDEYQTDPRSGVKFYHLCAGINPRRPASFVPLGERAAMRKLLEGRA